MLVGALICTILGAIFVVTLFLVFSGHHTKEVSESTPVIQPIKNDVQKIQGLAGRTLYNDHARQIHVALQKARNQGESEKISYLEFLAAQPGVTWLNGPTKMDPTGSRDIDTVRRTSKEADQLNQIVVYQLYAIPNRDACADYSKGGFATEAEYTAWVEKLSNALEGDAVFLLEADAIPHAINKDCISEEEASQRYALINSVVTQLRANTHVAALYLDVGHPEWIIDSTQLIEPLKAAGIDAASGIIVNVSNYIGQEKVLAWTTELLNKLGSNKTAVIDTSRNGKGAPGPEVKGEDRWCNPKGRAVGAVPSTSGLPSGIDAYLWVKNAGESDGSCRGYPEAGVFVDEIAIDLVKNR